MLNKKLFVEVLHITDSLLNELFVYCSSDLRKALEDINVNAHNLGQFTFNYFYTNLNAENLEELIDLSVYYSRVCFYNEE